MEFAAVTLDIGCGADALMSVDSGGINFIADRAGSTPIMCKNTIKKRLLQIKWLGKMGVFKIVFLVLECLIISNCIRRMFLYCFCFSDREPRFLYPAPKAPGNLDVFR